MKTTTTIKMAMGICVACLTMNAQVAEPVASDVVVRQRWPWSRLVDIDYVLTCDATQQVAIALSAYDGSAELELPPGSLTGDLFGVTPGACRIVWDPSRTTYTNRILTQFSVTLVPVPMPNYMIVDVSGGSSATAYPVTYTNAIAEYDLTNASSVYKTDKLVMRWIPPGTFQMGSPTDEVPRDGDPREKQHTVTHTKGYWMGVFELTKSQYARVMGGAGAGDKTPYNSAYYTTLRGLHTNALGVSVYNWPTNGHSVDDNTVLAKLRQKTGGLLFDLPTDAQWEYACRAGTTGKWNAGRSDLTTNDVSEIAQFCWYWNRGGASVKEVGLLIPNAWGLYDMHGNVWEWTLDWYDINYHNYSPSTDPLGPTPAMANQLQRCKRGGAYSATDGKWIRSAYRSNMPFNSTGADHGVRLCVWPN